MSRLTCLLIDDDPDDREIFALALDEVDKSYRLVTAKSGGEAIELFRNDPTFLPDFIFLDLNMPLMDGKECLSELKKIHHIKRTPIIIFSTSSYDKDVEDTKRLGATYFLTKPSSLKALTNFLMEIFKGKDLPYFLKA
jgi:CheY-like chemotaxis protein